MKIPSFYLQTLHHRLNVVGNNIANVNTVGFKETLQSMEETYDIRDLSNTRAYYGGIMPEANNQNIRGNQYQGRRFDFSPGIPMETEQPLDLALNGKGFFQILTPSGQTGFSRDGVFTLNEAGFLVNNQGMLLAPGIQIPSNTTQLSVSLDGRVTGMVDGDVEELGQVLLADFANPHGLDKGGENFFFATQASGAPVTGIPGIGDFGTITGGRLERSNTDLGGGMIQLIQVQRNYQMKTRWIKNEDEMIQQGITMRG